MTKQTKLELVQINAALAADNAALRKLVMDFEHGCEIATNMLDAARARILELEAASAMHTTPTRRVAYNMPQWQQDRAANMAAAKAAAMALGHVVRV